MKKFIITEEQLRLVLVTLAEFKLKEAIQAFTVCQSLPEMIEPSPE